MVSRTVAQSRFLITLHLIPRFYHPGHDNTICTPAYDTYEYTRHTWIARVLRLDDLSLRFEIWRADREFPFRTNHYEGAGYRYAIARSEPFGVRAARYDQRG